MVIASPLSGIVTGVIPSPTLKGPTGSGLARAVVLERDSNGKRNRGDQSENGFHRERGQEDSDKEYPVYDPHAGIISEEPRSGPVDVVA